MRRVIAIGCGVLLQALPVLAETIEASPIKEGKEQSLMYEWLIGGAFLVGCLVFAFMPSKRANVR